ncbi:ATP-binding protein [Streptomyces sp. SM12]|uniref:ATP-binding protein n=1 Tax=Streptomyces sp. SM12 TaxID=1071602 RepID=UPI000CD59801|nr:ATP-binding protein [Streptomyces sp. SM12]
MRIPIRHVAGNVVWTSHGTAWAIWRVEGFERALVSGAARRRYLDTMEGLLKGLKGREPMLLSLCPQVDPVTVAEQMTMGVDLQASGRYVEVVERVLDQLDELELTGRADWLAVPLPVSRQRAVRGAVSAAMAEVSVVLGLGPVPVTVAEEQRCVQEAAAMAEAWPAGVRIRPAIEAEILWIYGHSLRRGVSDPMLPGADARPRRRGRGTAALGQAVLHEGGTPEEETQSGAGGKAARLFGRRWLEVTTEHGSSYQALLGLSEMPETFTFPGGEVLDWLQRYDFPVDWCARLKVVAGAEAEAKSRQHVRELENQFAEHEGETAGPPPSLDKAAADMGEYRARMTASRTEVEVQAMVTMCVWGATPAEAEQRAQILASDLATDEYQLDRPRGEQESLWYGMLPGSRLPRVMAGYAQTFTARDFAMAAPYTGTALGDDRGPLYGLHTTSGGARPVLTDWALAPTKNASASGAWIGELGSGKTVAMKTAVHGVLAAGRRAGVPGSRGRALMVDRTPRREWAAFAEACPGSTQVITIGEQSAVSLDPLRLFADRKEAQRRTESFLSLLLGLGPNSDEGAALSEAVDAALAGPDRSMRGLVAELAQRAGADPASRTVARRLAAAGRKDLITRLFFDADLPVLQAGEADTIVFAVSELALPSQEELTRGVDQLEFEKLAGRAVMYLVAAVCRQVMFDPSRLNEFTVAVWDECWWLTSSPEGLRLLLEIVRDGRKHNAAAFVGSHDPHDIGPADSELGRIVLGLIPRKHLFRHTNSTLAARGLRFLGLQPDPELVTQVTEGLSPTNVSDAEREARAGECLHCDLQGRISAMKIVMPLDEAVREHMFSTPHGGLEAAA